MAYWSKLASSKVSRRRALTAAGATTLGASLLAACGGGGDEAEQANADKSGLVSQAVDTTKEAKRGGTLKFSIVADIPNFDSHFLARSNAEQSILSYNRLTRVKPGVLEGGEGLIEGDVAESWEFSADKLTLTIKLRPNVGMPPVAPVNGRALDAQDVIYSWNRFKANGTNRGDFFADVNPNAPVVSMTAPDNRTLVVKLASPVASIMSLFSAFAAGNFFVYPREAESQIDLRRSPLGAGPYYLAEYVPSSMLKYRRNPNYWDNSRAWADSIETPIVSENATGIAQLKAGGLYTYGVGAENVVQTKRDVMDINMYQTDVASIGVVAFFGFKATPADRTPFRDVRVRQAYSRAMDRDLFTETFGNVPQYTSQGLPVNTGFNTAVPVSAFKGWWIDPRSKDFGPNGVYFQHDIAEAKKLLAAAGYPNGLSVVSNQIGSSDYGANYARFIEVMEAFANEAGFRFEKAIQNYATNWMPEFRDSHGFFEGVAYRLLPSTSDPGDQLYVVYNKNGSVYYGSDPDGKGIASTSGPFSGDPTCDDLTNKMKTEFDDGKRKQYAHDLQKYLGKMQYLLLGIGGASGFNLAWPAVANWRVYRDTSGGDTWTTYWVDETKAPLKKA